MTMTAPRVSRFSKKVIMIMIPKNPTMRHTNHAAHKCSIVVDFITYSIVSTAP